MSCPTGEGFLFEPKWDGFRAIVFRDGEDVYIQSRDLRPLNRYFPELEKALAQALPKGCVIDGEIVVVGAAGLDFDALQQRIHPAASRVARLAKETPAALRRVRPAGRRRQVHHGIAAVRAPGRGWSACWARLPSRRVPDADDARSRAAQEWLKRFEGAGLDGVIAKPESAPYQPGKRAMLKIKHARTAECVVAGSAGTGTRRMRSARCCWACTTTPACCTTWA